jgi:competence protein ComEA
VPGSDDPLDASASSLSAPDGVAPPLAARARSPFGDLAGPAEPWWQRLRLVAAGGFGRPDRAVTRLVGVAVAAALVGAAAVWIVGTGAAGSAPPGAAAGLPLATRLPAPAGTTARSPGTGTAAVAAGSPTTVAGGWVAIAGAIVRPGLYRVAADTRLSALIAAAGGLAPDADGDRVNLAAPVRDGERIYVPHRGEPGAPPVVAGAPGSAGGTAGGGSGGGGTSAGPVGPVNLNRATAAELDSLPGVGPATAQAIIGHREANGPFRSVDDLAEVRGIGPAKLEQLRPLVTV